MPFSRKVALQAFKQGRTGCSPNIHLMAEQGAPHVPLLVGAGRPCVGLQVHPLVVLRSVQVQNCFSPETEVKKTEVEFTSGLGRKIHQRFVQHVVLGKTSALLCRQTNAEVLLRTICLKVPYYGGFH